MWHVWIIPTSRSSRRCCRGSCRCFMLLNIACCCRLLRYMFRCGFLDSRGIWRRPSAVSWNFNWGCLSFIGGSLNLANGDIRLTARASLLGASASLLGTSASPLGASVSLLGASVSPLGASVSLLGAPVSPLRASVSPLRASDSLLGVWTSSMGSLAVLLEVWSSPAVWVFSMEALSGSVKTCTSSGDEMSSLEGKLLSLGPPSFCKPNESNNFLL